MSVAWHLKIFYFFLFLYYTNWQEFTIVSFNHFDAKMHCSKMLANIHISNTQSEHIRWDQQEQHQWRQRWRRRQKNRREKKQISINLWNTVYGSEKIAFFFFPPFVLRSQHEIYDKYVGLVESEYWVHITGFIATFWQPAQRNKANIMTGH